MGSVESIVEQKTIGAGELYAVRVLAAVDVLHQHCAARSAVALPQRREIERRKEQRAVDVRQTSEVRAVWGIITSPVTTVVDGMCSRGEVRDEVRAAGGTIALPQLQTMRAIVGDKEQLAVHVRQSV